MPSKSKAQHSLMAMVAHDPAAAKRLGIPQSVGKEFAAADKNKSFKRGGEMAKANPFMEMIAKKKEMAGKPAKKMASGGMTSMGKVKTAAPSRDGIAERGKTKGKMVTMCGGGMSKGRK